MLSVTTRNYCFKNFFYLCLCNAAYCLMLNNDLFMNYIVITVCSMSVHILVLSVIILILIVSMENKQLVMLIFTYQLI